VAEKHNEDDDPVYTTYTPDPNDPTKFTQQVKTVLETHQIDLDDNDLYGKLQALRELMTESGEFATQEYIDTVDENAAVKRGIPYYQKALDLLANQIATQFNDLNDGYRVDSEGNYLNANSSPVTYTDPVTGETVTLNANTITDDQMEYLQGYKVKTYRVDSDGNFVTAAGDYIDAATGAAVKKEDVTDTTVLLNTATATFAKDAANMDAALVADPDAESGKTISYYLNYANDTPIIDKDTGALEINSENLNASMTEQLKALSRGDRSLGGVLFSNRGDGDETTGITASNISVSKGWSEGSTHIVPSFTETIAGDGIPSTARDNINHFINLMDKDLDYNPSMVSEGSKDEVMFSGSFQEFFAQMSATLGKDYKSTNILLATYDAAATELESSRESVYCVDLNDESMNMIQYQKAYSAACRLITVLDEALDKLINGTGVTT
jgi:flagellar hook-associated protein FlgK